MQIIDYIKPECISLSLKGDTKESLIRELAEMQFLEYPSIDKNEAIEGLLDREKLLTTAIGKGIAIPHARLKSSKEITVSLGILNKEIDFDSLDKKPVQIIFLVFFPGAKINLQLRFLARISRILHHSDLQKTLIQCQSPQEAYSTLKKHEETHF